eukprot:Gregarina_sp_Poly_1__1309@NODE_1321_length_4393_cov_152_206657_g597_i2_p7_GENE_NODE_1321_length_4393_cov_152_206657_g597_i2NODE_1321_length_4393_cov_152_206657_g597_i2_p7_ORF_typecomplete_len158_score21_90_NODE_1321_length_4393_cov_152_206657_g597_i224932966
MISSVRVTSSPWVPSPRICRPRIPGGFVFRDQPLLEFGPVPITQRFFEQRNLLSVRTPKSVLFTLFAATSPIIVKFAWRTISVMITELAVFLFFVNKLLSRLVSPGIPFLTLALDASRRLWDLPVFHLEILPAQWMIRNVKNASPVPAALPQKRLDA